MRTEVWVHETTGQTFTGRHLYLDFLRRRYRDRLALARLMRHRENAWATLQEIHQLTSIDFIEEFLNDHHREIETLCSDRVTRFRLVSWVKIKRFPSRDTQAHWSASLTYQYEADRCDQHWRTSRRDDRFDNNSWTCFTDIMKKLGIETNGGGGVNGHMVFRNVTIDKSRYESADVMEILAA